MAYVPRECDAHKDCVIAQCVMCDGNADINSEWVRCTYCMGFGVVHLAVDDVDEFLRRPSRELPAATSGAGDRDPAGDDVRDARGAGLPKSKGGV